MRKEMHSPVCEKKLYLESRGHIHLLYLLDKDEQEDLSTEERKVLRMLVNEIKKAK